MRRLVALVAVPLAAVAIAAGCGSDPQAAADQSLKEADFQTAAFGVSGLCLAIAMGEEAIANGEAPDPGKALRAVEKARADIPAEVGELAQLVRDNPGMTFAQDNGDAQSLDAWLADRYAGACIEAQAAMVDEGITGAAQ